MAATDLLPQRYPGIYPAICIDRLDPQGRMRLRVQVPMLFGLEITDWVEACLPTTTLEGALPPAEGTIVWVMFIAGDPEFPVWVGSGERGVVEVSLVHGNLQGLGGDDHPQYLNLVRHDTTSRHPVGTVVPAGTPGSSAVGDTVSAGTATTVARADHRHAREAFGTVASQTAFGAASGNGAATTVARSDHAHGTPAHGTAQHGTGVVDHNQIDNLTVGDAHTQYLNTARHDVTARHSVGTSIPAAAPGSSAVGDVAAEGSSTSVARSDHRHAREAFGNVTGEQGFGGSPSNGAAATVARSDHAHGTPAHGTAQHGSGVVDHNSIGNLTVGDPHTQYLTQGRGDARYSLLGHGHSGLGTFAATRADITPANGIDSRFIQWTTQIDTGGNVTILNNLSGSMTFRINNSGIYSVTLSFVTDSGVARFISGYIQGLASDQNFAGLIEDRRYTASGFAGGGTLVTCAQYVGHLNAGQDIFLSSLSSTSNGESVTRQNISATIVRLT